MQYLKLQHYKFERLADYTIEKFILLIRSRSQGLTNITLQHFESYWNAFIKWAKSQIEFDRKISIFDYGIITSQYSEKKNQEKIITFVLSDSFILQNNLKYRVLESHKGQINKTQPTIKLSFGLIFKNLPNENFSKDMADKQKDRLTKVITNFFFVAMNYLTKKASVEIDLEQLGKFTVYNKSVTYQPFIKSKINASSFFETNKMSVGQLLVGKSIPLFQKKNKNNQDTFVELNKNVKGNFQVEDNENKKIYIKSKSHVNINPLLQSIEHFQSPTRRFKKKQIHLGSQMLGAGTDPLNKDQNFSILANKVQQLINYKFQKPNLAEIRFPAILDKFSRTLAAPIAAQKFNSSISGRIGSNYSPFTKSLYLDFESKSIAKHPLVGSKVTFTANPDLLIVPLSQLEQMEFIDGKQDIQLKKRMQAKKQTYIRYNLYINRQIPEEYISRIQQSSIDGILDLIPSTYKYIDKKTVLTKTQEMLLEINNDYYQSIKKSILDYVIKDQSQRMRIGIMMPFKEVVDYGKGEYKGITANYQWRQAVAISKQNINNNLQINNQGTLNFMKEWKKFQINRFSILGKKKNMILQVRQFCRKLEEMIVEVQNDLKIEWVKQIAVHFNKESEGMKKKNELIFYQATATLMSNQLRSLITSILIDYRDFYKKFQHNTYYTPMEVIERQKESKNSIYEVFLEIKLEKGNGEIVFEKDLFTSVKPDLLKIIDSVIQLSNDFPRPLREKNLASQRKNLWQITKNDQIYIEVKNEIEGILDKNFQNIETTKVIYNEFKFLLDEKERVEEWCKSFHDIKEYRSEILKYQNLYNEIMEKLPFYIRMNIVLINACQIKKTFLSIITDINFYLINNVYEYIKKTNDMIEKKVDQIRNALSDKIENTEKLVELENFIDNVKKVDNKQILRQWGQLKKWIFFCYENGDYLKKNDFRSISQTAYLIFTLPDKIEEHENRIFKQRDDLQAKVNQDKKIFQLNVNEILKKIQDCIKQRPYKGGYEKKQLQLKELTENVATLINRMNEINKKEGHLGNTISQFPKITNAQKQIEPYYKLWNLVAEFEQAVKEWKQQNIKNLSPTQIETFFQKTLESANKIRQQLPAKSEIRTFCQKDLIEEIKVNNKEKLQLIRILANPGLKERHWKAFYNVTQNQIFNETEKLRWGNLKSIEDGGKIQELLEISQTATKEWNIEKIKNNMINQWKDVIVQIKEHKDTATYIITGTSVDQIQALLDDQIVKTVTMKGSPYAKQFEQEINQWEAWLRYTFSVFQNWVNVQGMWMYLQPVFTSQDIAKHLPLEHQHFEQVDRNWRVIMQKVASQLKVIQFTKNKKMLEILIESGKKLEIVHKGLSDYLESKRINFPRFFFLSNEELLEILSETKDPTRVQPHLKKCFQGIAKLEIDAEHKIHGMYSSQKQFVKFVNIVDTKLARGNVDQWLVSVEESMIESVKLTIETAYIQYLSVPRQQWVLGRCGMAVLNQDMTYWTKNTQTALIKNGLQGITQFSTKCQQNLAVIVKLVRQNIKSLDRCTLQALIVLDVHNSQVIKNLIRCKISNIRQFDWQAQLRYYWDKGTSVKIINAHLAYNYQYLGNSSRLVITPLTDRCYRTLCGALHLNYGGAPEGPAGTGKTQTVKDLAKALARQCVVYNCSDGLDYIAMGKFFKGIASAGAWSCFDQFNRINLQVLSVVAQQILTIQLARGQGLQQFMFEQTKIRLKPTANCFVTMNPGYAGRSQLPDNLKSLFRSVAMMVPDYALIAEISLYSFGFSEANNLAGKIVTTYKLCSEQLSSQDHYDYGMRAVKSVLSAAGNLKRKYPDEKESILMLRAISDVNLAKFLAFDIPLFKGIISDLFPNVILTEIDYSKMLECIDEELVKHNLFKVDYFVEKVIQLYQMIMVRHGLMVVGSPFAGKTSAINVLAGALTLLNQKGQMNQQKVQIISLNPKSLSMNQLYGFFDAISHQWFDGVLAVKFRQFAKSEQSTRKWLIFNGPIDAVWIENMNTVLDDNKKLCLNSGQIIAMNKTMNMIFEPLDLLAASPATVSRCGMIYMEPFSLGWIPHFERWINKLPTTLKVQDLSEIRFLANAYVPVLIDYIKGFGAFAKNPPKQITPTQIMNMVVSLLRIFLSLLKDFEQQANYNAHQLKHRLGIICNRFVFSVVWSFGGSLVFESRKPFDIFLKRLFGGDIPLGIPGKKKLSLPERGMLYQYCFEIKKKITGQRNDGEWIKWIDTISENQEISKNQQAHQILVKTQDTVRYTYMLDMNIKSEFPTLFCGPTGTGKSRYIKSHLDLLQKIEKYNTIEIGFSAQTTSNQTQQIIDSKLDRRAKGVFGPKPGFKYILFVDDFNMPAKEKWGAQPPIQLLRQLLDQGGWYDNKDKQKSFRKIIDLLFVSAMGPPGGGRTFITPRMTRHLNLVSLTQFDNETMSRIYCTILKWFFMNNGFTQEVVKLELKAVSSTLQVYVQACNKLLPTPSKSHYLFNLRDFSKVILGICMCDKDRVTNQDTLVRLWVHQVWRVFSDRLTNEQDKLMILSWIKQTVKKIWILNFDTVFSYLDTVDQKGKGDGIINSIDEIRRLIWSDCMAEPGAPSFYQQIRDKNKLQMCIEQSLSNYNEISGKPMDLVLFDFAIEHLLIITRILKQPGGNALLIGVGGSGRQSMTKLSTFNSQQKTIEIQITKQYGKVEWLEDIKKILINAGKNVETIFLFTDSQIKHEFFVEDINNLLNTGEVPNLFPTDQKANLIEMVRNDARIAGKAPQSTPTQLYNFFMERVKKNLHIVLCFSPIGDAFRTRVRMFPSLVNCCTIDWFREWPKDALVSVANNFLKKLDVSESIRVSCVQMVQHFHESTIRWSQQFLLMLHRHYYVTPTSYIDMITTFKSLLGEKRKYVQSQISKYENGCKKIIQTQKAVGGMQQNLEILKPQLLKAAEQTKEKMIIVTKEKAIADQLKEVVEGEEKMVKEAVDKASQIAAECRRELDKALPDLINAQKAVERIDRRDIDQMRTMKFPSVCIKAVLRAIVLIFDPNPTQKYRDQKTLKNVTDWWAASLKLLNQDILKKMLNFKVQDVDEKTIRGLQNFLNSQQHAPNLQPQKVLNASKTAAPILDWVVGVKKYYYVNKDVQPKKRAQQKAQGQANQLKAQLAIKQKELKRVVDRVQQLNNDLNSAISRKQHLQIEYDICQKKLKRARSLIDNLGGQKGRWAELAKKLHVFKVNLSGDILVSAGMIAYLGAFTSKFRNQITQEWVTQCRKKQIPSSQSQVFSLKNILGDPVKIREWNIHGLPSDIFSIQNAIIISKSKRWPLCIDPQGQANKWIKKMNTKMHVVKLSDSDFLRTIENSIQFGQKILLENVGEELDPGLNPILLKQTYGKGTTQYIKLSQQLQWNNEFYLYITSKLRNPHYLPELSTKVTLLNFMITFQGLNDQLLGKLVKNERPDLEIEKERLIIEGANNKKQMQIIENKILEVLSHSENILEDEQAINVLSKSKETSNEIATKQKIADETQINIDNTRHLYQPVSKQASCLFFTISDLANIDPMYQYSLTYYIDLFNQGILKSQKSDDFNQRLKNLITYFQLSLYNNICRSLFEKDKLLFSLLIAVRLLQFNKEIDGDHLRYFITGLTRGITLQTVPQKPNLQFLPQATWDQICRISHYDIFKDLYKKYYEPDFLKKIEQIYNSPNPEEEKLPKELQHCQNTFYKLLFLRTVRLDKLVPAVQNFVKLKLGQEFIYPPAFDLAKIFPDSNPSTPLIFVLSPGSDPFSSLNIFSQIKKIKITSISLGQGQGPLAQKHIKEGITDGSWVVLQNCHLAVTWMPTLQKIVQEIGNNPNVHTDFRLWLTSYPSKDFPSSILQGGVKMTNQPPMGLKSNLIVIIFNQSSFLTDPISNQEFFKSCVKPRQFRKLLYGLCFFHAVIQERRNYGALGWNIPYEFNQSDLRICVKQLKMFLDESQEIPYQALCYLTSECNYGGRVTDGTDRRLIITLLKDYYKPEVLQSGYKFAANAVYLNPDLQQYEDYLTFIKDNFPINTQPDVFGFHANANITKDVKQTNSLLSSLQLCYSEGTSGQSKSMQQQLAAMILTILQGFPEEYNIDMIIEKFPVIYSESMNTVLIQQLTRFNNLINIIHVSIKQIQLALDGLILMSSTLQKAAKAIYDGKVPQLWMEKSYPSLKPLGFYVKDLKERLKNFEDWINNGKPVVFWLSGFFFTQSFLTGVLQNYARKYTIPIDQIVFDFKIMSTDDPKQFTESPEDGTYIYGLFLEGAKWNYDEHCLDQSDPKILFVKSPVIQLKPCVNDQIEEKLNYESPVYKISSRRGVLSTTGHSTNFVMFIKLPSKREEEHWIKRGVAFLTQLDF